MDFYNMKGYHRIKIYNNNVAFIHSFFFKSRMKYVTLPIILDTKDLNTSVGQVSVSRT